MKTGQKKTIEDKDYIEANKIEIENFVDLAQVSQGIIPEDILSQKDAVGYLPAFFRTLRNERPTQEEICKLIELIRNA